MGHRPYQHPILNDGAAGHPLHDASGDFQQIWVGDADDHVFGRLLLGERNLLDIGVKIGGGFPRDGGQNLGGTFGHLLALCHGDGLRIGGRVKQLSVYAVVAVGIQ